MNTCLCCNSSLLRHIGPSGIYWYCTTCRQNMPHTTATEVTQSFSMVQRRPRSERLAVPVLPVLPVLPVAT